MGQIRVIDQMVGCSEQDSRMGNGAMFQLNRLTAPAICIAIQQEQTKSLSSSVASIHFYGICVDMDCSFHSASYPYRN